MTSARTLFEALDSFALSPTSANSTALVYYDTASKPSTRVTYTFSDLARLSLHAAQFLAEKCGVKKGDTVLLYLPNTPQWLAMFYATARLGAAAVALNTRFRESEMRHFIRTSGSRLVILEQGFNATDYLSVIAGSLEGSGTDSIRVVDISSTTDGASAPRGVDVIKYGLPSSAKLARLDSLRSNPALSQGKPDDLSATFTTSGTTGLPKLASHAQVTLVTHANTTQTQWRVSPKTNSHVFITVPFCGVFGLAQSTMTLLSGSTMVTCNLFQPDSAAQIIDDEKITHVLAPDNVIHSLLELHGKAPGSKTKHNFSTWKYIGYANFTSSLGSAIIELVKLLPGMHLSGLYGSSELLALMSAWEPSDPLEVRTLGGGRLNPGIKVRVVDSDGSPIQGFGFDNKGELEFSGYSMLRRYIGNEEAMKKNAYEVDGVKWFKSGDLGYLVEPLPGKGPSKPTATDFAQGNATDSYVYLSRLGDSLRLRGFLVDPTEIEATIVKHEWVGEVQVVGVNLGSGKGEDAVAFIIPDSSVASKFPIGSLQAEKEMEKSVLLFCKPLLANYKVPARCFLVDEFPTTNGPNGVKIQKVKLREMATGKMSAKL